MKTTEGVPAPPVAIQLDRQHSGLLKESNPLPNLVGQGGLLFYLFDQSNHQMY